ncbi:MAG: hypothetical protein A7315_02235 [Candidatus Altiarchaeales archaeon WOR_SM1_79]|nr:MAG: hypothetical protein A7315_02235 [Candidatus Altiarchaeales archaeon WOR_SM1_79]
MIMVTGVVSGQDVILSVDEINSFIVDCGSGQISWHTCKKLRDEGKVQVYSFKEFKDLNPEDKKLHEGHTIMVYAHVKKVVSTVPDDYVLELESDLDNARYMLYYERDEKSCRSKIYVWDNDFDHRRHEFGIHLIGQVPKPTVLAKDPNFDDYSEGSGPGEGDTAAIKLAIFAFRDADGDLGPKEQEVIGHEMAFKATNPTIEKYLKEIEKNCKEIPCGNIKKLAENGHVGWALEISRELKDVNKTSIGPIILGALIGLVIGGILGFAIFKMTTGREEVPDENIERLGLSESALNKNLEGLEGIQRSLAQTGDSNAPKLYSIIRSIKRVVSDLRFMKEE